MVIHLPYGNDIQGTLFCPVCASDTIIVLGMDTEMYAYCHDDLSGALDDLSGPYFSHYSVEFGCQTCGTTGSFKLLPDNLRYEGERVHLEPTRRNKEYWQSEARRGRWP